MINNIFIIDEEIYPRIELIGADKENWNFEEVNFLGFQKIGSRYFLNDMETLIKSDLGEAKELAPYLFQNDINLENVTLSDEIEILSEGCFKGCSKIDFDKLPDNLNLINKDVFNGCNSLTLIELPSLVTSIGDNTFRMCTSLALTSLPENLNSIGGNAFSTCINLDLQSLPTTITEIGIYAFLNCSKLALTELPDNFGPLLSVSGIFVNCRSLNLTELPESTTSIGTEVFRGCTALNASLPEGLITINSQAFRDCTSLDLTSLPSTVTSIGSQAFQNCTALQIEGLPEGVTSIKNSTFYNCTSLTTFTIPSGITLIENNAFTNCSDLATINYNAKNVSNLIIDTNAFMNVGKYTDGVNVVFGDLVTRIPAYLFHVGDSLNSPNIKEITIGENIASIGNSAFSNCVNLTNINYNAINMGDLNGNNSVFYNIGINSSGVSVILGGTVTRIPAYLFHFDDGLNYFNIKEITIGENITSIGERCFFNCANLTQINYNAINVIDTDLNSSSAIFYGVGVNTDGTTVVFGESVIKIPKYLFCLLQEKIKEVILGTNIISIGDYSFGFCSHLTTIEIFGNIQTISQYAFANCSSLTTIKIHKTEDSVPNSPWGASNAAIYWEGQF